MRDPEREILAPTPIADESGRLLPAAIGGLWIGFRFLQHLLSGRRKVL